MIAVEPMPFEESIAPERVESAAREACVRFTNEAVALSWYYVAASSRLARGKVLRCEIPGETIALYRGESGELHALSAQCPHMGADLSRGDIVGERLRCPLHHHVIGCAAAGDKKGGECTRSFPTAERHGSIFVFNAPEALFPPPAFDDIRDGELATLAGEPYIIDCAWQALAINGCDAEHFKAVHRRRFIEAPLLSQPSPHSLRLSYVSSVVGNTLSDRAMKWLSRDRVKVTMTSWGGTIMLAESDLGRVRSAIMLDIQPKNGKSQTTFIFCVRRSPFRLLDALRLRVTRWLFTEFFKNDVAIMEGMKFSADLEKIDPLLVDAIRFIRTRPGNACIAGTE